MMVTPGKEGMAMIEKQNLFIEKDARGDSGVLDDVVDFATVKFKKTIGASDKERKAKEEVGEANI